MNIVYAVVYCSYVYMLLYTVVICVYAVVYCSCLYMVKMTQHQYTKNNSFLDHFVRSNPSDYRRPNLPHTQVFACMKTPAFPEPSLLTGTNTYIGYQPIQLTSCKNIKRINVDAHLELSYGGKTKQHQMSEEWRALSAPTLEN